jgi:hypothetical protein
VGRRRGGIRHTASGVSSCIALALTPLYIVLSSNGILVVSTGSGPMSTSFSGKKAKSIVELSPTAFMARDVLNCLVTGAAAAASPLLELEGAWWGRRRASVGDDDDDDDSDVRVSVSMADGKVAGPVMCSWRALRESLAMARAVGRVAAIGSVFFVARRKDSKRLQMGRIEGQETRRKE